MVNWFSHDDDSVFSFTFLLVSALQGSERACVRSASHHDVVGFGVAVNHGQALDGN
jgi:hypothetical protein